MEETGGGGPAGCWGLGEAMGVILGGPACELGVMGATVEGVGGLWGAAEEGGAPEKGTELAAEAAGMDWVELVVVVLVVFHEFGVGEGWLTLAGLGVLRVASPPTELLSEGGCCGCCGGAADGCELG